MKIVPASIEQAESIASLIMLAMNHECCQNFAGPSHTLEDFHRMMTTLVRRDDSQYSYRNAMVALDDNTTDGHPVVAGVIVGYDGADLHRLRETFSSQGVPGTGLPWHGRRDAGRRVLYRLACCQRKLPSSRTRYAVAKKAHRSEGAETACRTARRQRQSRGRAPLSKSGL